MVFDQSVKHIQESEQQIMFNKRKLLMTGLAAAIAVSLSSVGIHTLQAQDAEKATVVTLNMSEYAFQVNGQAVGVPLTLKTGTLYNLIIKGTGTMGHEIWFGKDLKKQEGRIDGYSTNLFTGVDMTVTLPASNAETPLEIDTTAFYEVYLNPGESVQLAFTLPASTVGTWELGCFRMLSTAKPATESAAAATMAMPAATASVAPPSPSHYDVGMKLPLIVQ